MITRCPVSTIEAMTGVLARSIDLTFQSQPEMPQFFTAVSSLTLQTAYKCKSIGQAARVLFTAKFGADQEAHGLPVSDRECFLGPYACSHLCNDVVLHIRSCHSVLEASTLSTRRVSQRRQIGCAFCTTSWQVQRNDQKNASK